MFALWNNGWRTCDIAINLSPGNICDSAAASVRCGRSRCSLQQPCPSLSLTVNRKNQSYVTLLTPPHEWRRHALMTAYNSVIAVQQHPAPLRSGFMSMKTQKTPRGPSLSVFRPPVWQHHMYTLFDITDYENRLGCDRPLKQNNMSAIVALPFQEVHHRRCSLRVYGGNVSEAPPIAAPTVGKSDVLTWAFPDCAKHWKVAPFFFFTMATASTFQ